MRNFSVFFSALLVVGVVAYPVKKDRYSRKSGVLFGGYYSNPKPNNGYYYTPQGSMTALVSGDAVATNTFSGGLMPWGWSPNEHRPREPSEYEEDETPEASEEIPARKNAIEVEEPEEEEEDETEAPPPKKTKAPRRSSKKKKPVRPPPVAVDEEDQEEEQQSWSRDALPSFFFPVSISGLGGGGLSRQNEDGVSRDWSPGQPIAVANAVSTGKGGVASSHATAFADPAAWAALARGVTSGGGGGVRTRRQGRG